MGKAEEPCSQLEGWVELGHEGELRKAVLRVEDCFCPFWEIASALECCHHGDLRAEAMDGTV